MNKVDLGLIRGTMWYAGKSITGNSSAEKTYPTSGITKAYANDLYINVDNGNIFQCVNPGDPDVATWTYIGCIEGPQPGIENSLKSNSTTLALSAKMGKSLNDKINEAGLYPYTVLPSLTKPTYLLNLEIEDKDTTITITDEDGNVGTYEVRMLGISDKQTVTIPINNIIGFPGFGAILRKVHSSNAVIYKYSQYDEETQIMGETTLNLWQAILDQTVDRKGAFVEDGVLYLTAEITRVIDGEVKELYPVTHAEAVWYNKAKGELLSTKIIAVDGDISRLNEAVEGLDERLTVAEEDIDNLEEYVEGIPDQLQRVINEINLLKGKIIDDREGILGVEEKGYITGGQLGKWIIQNLTTRLSEDLEWVQLWDGTDWVNWKRSGLLFNGFYVKEGICSSLYLPNGFTNGTTVQDTEKADGEKSSYNKDAIEAVGYDTLHVSGTVRGATEAFISSGVSTSGYCEGHQYMYVDFLNANSGEVLATHTVGTFTGKAHVTHGEKFMIYDKTESFEVTQSLAGIENVPIRVRLRASSTAGTYNGYHIAEIKLMNIYATVD